jgi:hypothetical protein
MKAINLTLIYPKGITWFLRDNFRWQNSGGRFQVADFRRQILEGRFQKAEFRRQNSEGRFQLRVIRLQKTEYCFVFILISNIENNSHKLTKSKFCLFQLFLRSAQ